MSGMWRRWARRRRLVGISFLTLTAISLGVAVLLFFTGHGFLAGVTGGAALGLCSYAVVEFVWAAHYARLGA